MKSINALLKTFTLTILSMGFITACGSVTIDSAGLTHLTKALSGQIGVNTQSVLTSPSVDADNSNNSIVIRATAASGAIIDSVMNSDGTFEMELEHNRTYVLSVFMNEILLGVLTFDIDDDGSDQTVAFKVDNGDSVIALGEIECEDGICTAEVNPLTYNDRDDDGISDYDDSDDDNDSIDDVDESDSDDDGICDDDELDDDEDNHHHNHHSGDDSDDDSDESGHHGNNH